MLTGEYNHQLDAKNRIRIPAKLKKELGEGYCFAKGSNGCISVFPQQYKQELFAKLNEVKLTDEERQKSLRLYAKSFVTAEEDNQGRVILSPELRKHAGIDKDCKDLVICGAVTRVEIWSKKVYEEYFKDEAENFDELFAKLDI